MTAERKLFFSKELARYDTTPVQGGIPKSFGYLVNAVVTALAFEDDKGTIRFVIITGVTESKLTRN